MRWSSPLLAPIPPKRSDDGNDGSGLCARDERHQHARVAVSGRPATRWPAVNGRDLEDPRQPGGRAAQQVRDRRSAGGRGKPPATPPGRFRPPCGAAKPKSSAASRTQASRQATTPKTSPQCTSRPGQVAQHVVVADGQRRRLVQAGRVAQRTLDDVIQERDRDVVAAAGCRWSR